MKTRRAAFSPGAALVVVALPGLITWLLVRGLLGASLLDFVPASDDEMYYWHQIATFRRAGLDGGFYTYEEQVAAWPVTRFGAHGPMFPALYGSLGRLFGWERYSSVVFNLALVTLALAVLLRLARPGRTQLGVLALLLATFWPLFWELVSAMQEGVHYSVALLLAAACHRLLERPGARPRWLTVLFVVAMLAVSLVRPFWAMLLVPLGVLSLRRTTPRAIALVTAAGSGALLVVFLAVKHIAAPYPSVVRDMLTVAQVSPLAGLRVLVEHVDVHLHRIVRLEAPNALFDVTRFQFLGVLLALVGVALWRRLRRPRGRPRTADHGHDELLHVFNLASILIALVALYVPVGYPGFRLLAPYLLMTVVVLVLRRRLALASLLIASNLLVAPVFAGTFARVKARNFAYDEAAVQAFVASVDGLLDYQAGDGPWANTVLLDGDLLCDRVRCDYVTGIPAGRGISVVFFPRRLEAPVRSKYLLLGETGLQELQRQLGPALHLRPLRQTPVGMLYLNLDFDRPVSTGRTLPCRRPDRDTTPSGRGSPAATAAGWTGAGPSRSRPGGARSAARRDRAPHGATAARRARARAGASRRPPPSRGGPVLGRPATPS